MIKKELIMKIDFTGHGIDVTHALKKFTEEKFTRLERHFDRITAIHVTFQVEKLSHVVEATLLITKGDIHASATASDMYAAVDELVDKLNRQIIKHKEKINDHRE
jgi:putative sigma-54 modulation protein